MDQHLKQLAEIMHKVAFKVPWQQLKLEEAEIRLLDKATGEQMVDIAYKNRIPYARFIHNADELIDEFNEEKFRQYIREVKNLKKLLEAPFKCKETVDIQIEPIEVDSYARERELMQAAIDEVLGEDETAKEHDESEDLDIGSFLGKLNNGKRPQDQLTVPNQPQQFINAFTSHNELGTSVSLQRDSNIFADRNILTESRHLEDPLNLQVNDGFGEATLEELAALGMLDGENGREIFNKLVDSEQQGEIRRTDELPINEPVRIENPLLDPEMPMEFNITPLQVPEIPQIELLHITNDGQNIPQVEPLNITNEGQAVPQIEQLNVTNEGQAVPQIEQLNITNIGQAVPPTTVPPTPLQSDSDRSIINYNERLARIERAPSVHESQPAQVKVVKPKRKQRGHRINKLESNEENVALIKFLVVNSKDKPFKKRKNPHPIMTGLHNNNRDLLKNLEDMPDYIVPEQEDVDEVLGVEPEVPQDPQQNKTLEMPIEPENISAHKRPVASPELENVSKRPRFTPIPVPQEQPMEIPELEAIVPPPFEHQPIEELMSLQVPDIILPETLMETSLIPPPQKDNTTGNSMIDVVVRDLQEKSASFVAEPAKTMLDPILPLSTTSDSLSNTPLVMRKKNVSAVIASLDNFRKKLHLQNSNNQPTITSRDIVFGQLRILSKEIESSLHPKVPDENVPQSQAFFAAPLPPPPQHYREFRKNGIDCVQYKNKRGKVAHHEEYNIEMFMLYLQVRKYMKLKKTNKLVIEEVLRDKVFRLRHTESTHVMMIRLWRLCDHGLLIGKWSDDDEILEIELPFNKTISEDGDKENIPSKV